MRRILALAAFLAAAAALPASAQTRTTTYGSMKSAALGANADLHGAVPFLADNDWNTPIAGADPDPDSNNLIASIGLDTGLHPDFGAGTYKGKIIGIPYLVVGKGTAAEIIKYTAYGDESDPGPFPIPDNAPIEGHTTDGSSFGGDRHVIVINKHSNKLFELWHSFPRAAGGWKAGSGARFDLTSDDVRPGGEPGWTSADAAGLPIFPGLVRYDEAHAGLIPHALRFTVGSTRQAYVPPANHWVGDNASVDLPPMGMRVRLKSIYAIPDGFSPETKAILAAMKTYGMFVADIGSNWYISGAPSKHWNNDALVSELSQVTGSNFEVVKMVGVVTPPPS